MKRNTKEYAVAGELFYMITYRVFYTILHSNDFSATASTVTRGLLFTHPRTVASVSAAAPSEAGPRKGLSDSPRTRPVHFSVVFN